MLSTATFALGRDAEWAGRLFVLDMLEDRMKRESERLYKLHIVSPALVGQEVVITSVTDAIEKKSKMACSFTAKVGDRVSCDRDNWANDSEKSTSANLIEEKAK